MSIFKADMTVDRLHLQFYILVPHPKWEPSTMVEETVTQEFIVMLCV